MSAGSFAVGKETRKPANWYGAKDVDLIIEARDEGCRRES